jgi:hypothetical protein
MRWIGMYVNFDLSEVGTRHAVSLQLPNLVVKIQRNLIDYPLSKYVSM